MATSAFDRVQNVHCFHMSSRPGALLPRHPGYLAGGNCNSSM